MGGRPPVQDMTQETATTAAILAHLKAATCIGCGAPAACWGTSEGQKRVDPMCDECCGHGNKDGWCTAPWDEHLTGLAAKLASSGFQLTDDSERMYKLLFPETDE